MVEKPPSHGEYDSQQSLQQEYGVQGHEQRQEKCGAGRELRVAREAFTASVATESAWRRPGCELWGTVRDSRFRQKQQRGCLCEAVCCVQGGWSGGHEQEGAIGVDQRGSRSRGKGLAFHPEGKLQEGRLLSAVFF